MAAARVQCCAIVRPRGNHGKKGGTLALWSRADDCVWVRVRVRSYHRAMVPGGGGAALCVHGSAARRAVRHAKARQRSQLWRSKRAWVLKRAHQRACRGQGAWCRTGLLARLAGPGKEEEGEAPSWATWTGATNRLAGRAAGLLAQEGREGIGDLACQVLDARQGKQRAMPGVRLMFVRGHGRGLRARPRRCRRTVGTRSQKEWQGSTRRWHGAGGRMGGRRAGGAWPCCACGCLAGTHAIVCGHGLGWRAVTCMSARTCTAARGLGRDHGDRRCLVQGRAWARDVPPCVAYMRAWSVAAPLQVLDEKGRLVTEKDNGGSMVGRPATWQWLGKGGDLRAHRWALDAGWRRASGERCRAEVMRGLRPWAARSSGHCGERWDLG